MRRPVLGASAKSGSVYIDRRVRLAESLCLDPNGFALDYGCGDGTLTERLPGAYLWGIDVRAEEIQKFHARKTDRRGKFLRAGCYSGAFIPFEKSTFEVVYAWDVLEHVADLERSLQEILRVLRPRGHFLLTVPNRYWPVESHGLWIYPHRIGLVPWLPTAIHERISRARVFTPRRISRILSRAGFEVQRSEYLTAPLDTLENRRTRDFLRRSRLFRQDVTRNPFLATAVFVHARRPNA